MRNAYYVMRLAYIAAYPYAWIYPHPITLYALRILPLSLLMLGVAAYDPDHARALDDPALRAARLYRCSYLHFLNPLYHWRYYSAFEFTFHVSRAYVSCLIRSTIRP